VILRARTAAEGRTVPLGDLAEVVFGLKTGCNDFFYLDDEGPAPDDPDLLRLCRSRLSGERHPIEARFLVPVVTTLKEIEGLDVRPERLRRRLLAIPAPADLRGTRAEVYVRLGERRGVHRLASVASRRPWYAVEPPGRPLRAGSASGAVARSRRLRQHLFRDHAAPRCSARSAQAVLNATRAPGDRAFGAREITGAGGRGSTS
jgi:hypothetical protein